jgi:hypothetical protein
MAEASRRQPPRRRSQIASTEQYNAFIQQIDLQSVWLASAKVENGVGAEPPDRTDVSINRFSTWGVIEGGFLAFDTYTIVLGAPRAPAATIEVTFGLDYRSALVMTDALFEPFQQVNLPLNAWPYAREFVASATARMNWVRFTLPALRLDALSPAGEHNKPAAPRKAPSRAMGGETSKARTAEPGIQRVRTRAQPP